jgi:tripartite-type tricarboxylate transporter receptor subunit TctC
MTLPRRRQFLHLAAGAVATPLVSRFAMAQAYPSRPVRLVCPTPAGGQLDIITRLIGQWLAERLGQPFIVENRSGAGGNIGTEAVLHAPADGYTLLVASATNAINASLYADLKFNFIRDAAPVATINRIPLVLEVHPSFPSKTVSELIANAKFNPGKVSLGTGTKGTGPNMAAELFKVMADVDLVVVAYRAEAQMLTDLIGGQLQAGFSGISSSLENIRVGKLRALAMAGMERFEALPDTPTIGQSIPGYEASGWCGIVAPRNTPSAVIDRLNSEINAGLADPRFKARLADVGVTVFATSPLEFSKHIVNETEKWAKLVRIAGLKPE